MRGARKAWGNRDKWTWKPKAARVGVGVVGGRGHQYHTSRIATELTHKKVPVSSGSCHCSPKGSEVPEDLLTSELTKETHRWLLRRQSRKRWNEP